MRVLIIEDSENDFLILSRHLAESKDFTIEWRDSLQKALSYLESASIDLVITDFALPDAQGLEIFQQLQDRFPQLPVVIVSGTSTYEQAAQAVQRGAQDYLEKGRYDNLLLAKTLHYAYQRKHNETALRAAEERYRHVIEDQTDLICRYKPDFTLTFVNHAYSDLLGLTADELVGCSILDLVPVDEHSIVLTHLKSLNASKPVATSENRLVIADDSTRWFQWKDHAIFDDEGHLIEYQGVGRDISERKRAEEAEWEQRRLADALRESLVALTSSLTVDEVMEQILEYAAAVVAYDAGSIILFEGDQGRIAYLRGFAPHAEAFLKNFRFSLETSQYWKLRENKEPYLIQDTKLLSEWVTLPITDWIRSTIGIPIEIRGGIIGLLAVDSATPNRFQFKDVENLRLFAHYTSLALENAYHVSGLENKVNQRTTELNHAKERVEAILNNSMDGILLARTDLRIDQANTAFNQLFTCQMDGYFNHSLLELMDETESNRIGEALQTVVKEQSGTRFETRAQRKDGSTFDAEFSVGYIKAVNSRTASLVCTIRDISQRKEQERELRFHASLQETVTDAVIATDMEFHIQSWNRGAETLYGWRAEEALGKSTNEILHTQFDVAAERDRMAQELMTQGSWQGEVEQRHKDGSKIYVIGSIGLFRNQMGEPMGVVAVNRNITERKEREQQLRYQARLLENVGDAIIGTDLEFRIQSWNKAAESIYGWQAEEVLGKLTQEILQPKADNREIGQKLRTQLMENRHWEGEITHCHRNGSDVYIQSVIDIVTDETGTAVGIVAVNRDTTENKKSEQALREQEEQEHEFQQYLKALHEITIELTQIDQLDEFYKRVVQLGLQHLGFERLALFLYDGQNAIGTYGTTINGDIQDERNLKFAPKADGMMLRALLRSERFSYDEDVRLYDNLESVSQGWNAAGVLWNGEQSLGWLTADSAISHKPATKPMLDILALYSLTIGSLLARKQTEVALQKSAAEIHDLYNNAPCGYHSLNQEGVFVQINDTELKWLGYSREALIGKLRISDIMTPESLQRFQQHFPVFKQQGWLKDVEFDLIRKDNTVITVLLNATAIYDEQGQYVQSRSTVFDITERKQVQAALDEERNQLRTLIDAVPDFIYVKDLKHRFVLTNIAHAMARKNSQPDELIGKSDFDYFPVEMAEQFQSEEAEIFRTGEPLINYEQPSIGQNGIIWASTNKVPLYNLDNEIIGLVGVTRDITESKRSEEALRESEERYRWLIETMQGGAAMYDTDEKITYVNDRFCALLGYTREELMGTRSYDYVDQTNTAILDDQVKQRRKAESTSYELVARRKDGQPIYLLVSGSPLLDKSGTFIGSFAVTTDITAQKQAEQTLRQALEAEKELGELKSRFVSMASHEFRTPLATILATSETLIAYREKLTEDQIVQKLNRIQEQVQHLKEIMDEVLQLTRMQMGRAEFNPDRIDLDELFKDILDEFQNHPEMNHELVYTNSEAPLRLRLDKKLMRQVISNLISNAIKYSPGKSQVFVNVEPSPTSVLIKVGDKGIGIPEADLKHLFEPFHRATNVGTISGTGLGLVIAKHAVELHGGTMTVESQVDTGTVFHVSLPLHTEDASPK